MSTNPTVTLYIGSTNLIELTGLQDTTTLAYPTDATVTATLYDGGVGASPVTGASNVALSYVSGTSGAATQYRGTFPATVTLAAHTYTLEVTATDTSGNARVFVALASAVNG